ncbi:hypothetical protein UCRPC4_g02485 [Phaeomoniella chlamydospora]|uniref:Uncharacterized protein n=1 Tax=Phaeomoniella chlamydospora TaxID=158046 RepID=A0A0G2H6R2_PHACM|nr:hypothetical protein UCRPC4_g02485 [Phaeomoniella chlamydospora]
MNTFTKQYVPQIPTHTPQHVRAQIPRPLPKPALGKSSYTVLAGSRQDPIDLISPTYPRLPSAIMGPPSPPVANEPLILSHSERCFVLFLYLHDISVTKVCRQFEAKPFRHEKGWASEARLQESLRKGWITRRPSQLSDMRTFQMADTDGSLHQLIGNEVDEIIRLASFDRWYFNLQAAETGHRTTKEQKNTLRAHPNHYQENVLRRDQVGKSQSGDNDATSGEVGVQPYQYRDLLYDWDSERRFLIKKLKQTWEKEIEMLQMRMAPGH